MVGWMRGWEGLKHGKEARGLPPEGPVVQSRQGEESPHSTSLGPVQTNEAVQSPGGG